tara:strand:- start:9522 stop:9776 length:255 start_codon:yes stop_codon:yes gene_type:complete
MTSREPDWIDDFLDDQCSLVQMGIIEQLLITSSVSNEYNNINLNDLTYGEAEEAIKNLRENDNPRDTREQFYRAFGKYGRHTGD